MSIHETSTILSAVATVGFVFLATAPFDNVKPWMRILPLIVGLTAFLWMPWVVRLGKTNTDLALGKPSPTEVEAKP